MQLHQLNPSFKKKSRKRVGRGGKKGTYSGSGMKGQNARSGKGPRSGFAGGDTTMLKRLPKKRGTVGKVPIKRGSKPVKFKPVILNLKDINNVFKDGEIISYKSLLKKKLISKINKRTPKVKILGEGELKEKLVFKGVKISKKVKKEVGEKKSDIKKKIKKKRIRKRKVKKTKEVITKKEDNKKESKDKKDKKKKDEKKENIKEVKKENKKKQA